MASAEDIHGLRRGESQDERRRGREED